MTGRLEAIVGGKGSGGKYKGDYFIDKDEAWHESVEGTPDQTRQPGEPILIIFYRLDPNYLTRSLFNPETMEFEVQSPVVEIAKDSDDYIHYDSENEEDKLEHRRLHSRVHPHRRPDVPSRDEQIGQHDGRGRPRTWRETWRSTDAPRPQLPIAMGGDEGPC